MTIPDAVWPAAGVLIALLGILLGRRKDRDDQIKESAALNTKVDVAITEIKTVNATIIRTMDRQEQRDQDTQKCLAEQGKKLVELESSTKSAHHRLDRHEELIYGPKEGK